MSHFTVIVIGDDIEDQLEPYAEQDADKQYLVFDDREDEYFKQYTEEKTEVIELADGRVVTPYCSEFEVYNKETFQREYIFPADSVRREGTWNEVYPTFKEFVAEWHGQEDRDEEMKRYGYWYNPNAKWDWYSIGGRWTGYFKPKAGAIGELGGPGAFGNQPKDGWVDSLCLCDIDIEGMKQESIKEANEVYDKIEEALKGRPMPSWNAVREKHGDNIDAARSEYHALETVKDLNKAQIWAMGDLLETFGNSREEYVAKQVNATMVPYAVVKDGKWYQKGEMGWFGMSSDEMTQDEWNAQFWQMIESLDPETTLTLVDCHI